MKNLYKSFALVLTTLFVVACGGGGSDSPAPAPTPAPATDRERTGLQLQIVLQACRDLLHPRFNCDELMQEQLQKFFDKYVQESHLLSGRAC